MKKCAKEILKMLESHGFEAYIVGGYVRDFLLNKETNDIDICTDASIKDILSLFSGNVNDYDSFHMKVKDLTIDITTFREEKKYENRRPIMLQKADFDTDLKRRDFTINAICMDKNENIIDKLNGRKDLEEKIIRMIGDPIVKIKEDPLRILRAIRFATILNFTLEENLKKAIIEEKKLLESLSGFRIKEEISKILISPNYKKGLTFLKINHLDQYLGISYTNLVYTKDLCGMWAQIKTLRDFPFTKQEKENIVKIQEILVLKIITPEVIYKYGLYISLIAGEILGIEADSIHEMYKNMAIYKRKDLKISYEEITRIFNVLPSKKIKEIEEHLIHEILKGHLENEKVILQQYLLLHKERWFS